MGSSDIFYVNNVMKLWVAYLQGIYWADEQPSIGQRRHYEDSSTNCG